MGGEKDVEWHGTNVNLTDEIKDRKTERNNCFPQWHHASSGAIEHIAPDFKWNVQWLNKWLTQSEDKFVEDVPQGEIV